jgi:hypothetical protein
VVDKEYHRNWYRAKRANDPDFARKRKEYRLANYERLRAQEIASRQKNIEKHRASSRERMKQMRAERPEHVAKLRKRADLKRKYGITPEEKAAMVLSQGGCGICKTDAPGPSDWHVDHCHNTGRVRGILCNRCNLMLGHARDNTTTLSAAIDYLQRDLTQRGNP